MAPSLVVLLGATAAIAISGGAASVPLSPGLPDQGGNFTRAAAAGFARYPLYWAGDQYDGLPMSAILDSSIGHDGVRTGTDSVTFIYGSCTPQRPSGSCAPPISIQVWPEKLRPVERDVAAVGASSVIRIPGQPNVCAVVHGSRVEFAAKGVTVIVGARGRADSIRVASRLRSMNALARSAGSRVDAPSAAARGRFRCRSIHAA